MDQPYGSGEDGAYREHRSAIAAYFRFVEVLQVVEIATDDVCMSNLSNHVNFLGSASWEL